MSDNASAFPVYPVATDTSAPLEQPITAGAVPATEEGEEQQPNQSAPGGPLGFLFPPSHDNVSKYRPVSIVTGITMSTIYALYATGKLDPNQIDCSNKFLPTLAREFTHVDVIHLLFNMVSLIYVSGLEAEYGSLQFLAIMGSIILISALGMMAVTKLFNVNCAIGFSGVLLGLMAFGLVSGAQGLNLWPLIYLIAVSVIPQPGMNISWVGHLVGIATGAVLGLGARAVGIRFGAAASVESSVP